MDLNKPPKKSVVLAGLALVVLLWSLVRFAGPAPEVAKTVTLPKISLENLGREPTRPEKVNEKPQLSLSWGRDPFALPYRVVPQSEPTLEQNESQGVEEEVTLPKLTAILSSGSRRLAVIDDLVVRVGDQVRGERIVKISSDRVILVGPGGRRVLKVSQPQTTVSSTRVGEQLDRR